MNLLANKTNLVSYGYIYGKHEDCAIGGHLVVEYTHKEGGPIEKSRMVANCLTIEAAMAVTKLFSGTLFVS